MVRMTAEEAVLISDNAKLYHEIGRSTHANCYGYIYYRQGSMSGRTKNNILDPTTVVWSTRSIFF
jgi:hypothetical protein